MTFKQNSRRGSGGDLRSVGAFCSFVLLSGGRYGENLVGKKSEDEEIMTLALSILIQYRL